MVVLRHLHNVDGVVARERAILPARDLQVTRIDVFSSSRSSALCTFVFFRHPRRAIDDGVANDDLLWLSIAIRKVLVALGVTNRLLFMLET